MESLYNLKYKILNLEDLDVAFKIQKETWPDDPDYEDLYDKATNPKDNNCIFLVYDKDVLIGITGVDVYDKYPDTIWLDWFTILSEHRRKGYGKKVLLDTIHYCKKLNKYNFFRVDTTYYENRPALILYDKIMQLKKLLYFSFSGTKLIENSNFRVTIKSVLDKSAFYVIMNTSRKLA